METGLEFDDHLVATKNGWDRLSHFFLPKKEVRTKGAVQLGKVNSVTRLEIIFRTKVVQICSEFLGCFKNHHIFNKTC